MDSRLQGADAVRHLLTGHGTFVDDIRFPGILHLAFVRSPHAHARIVAVDVAAARRTAGVAAVLAASDLGAVNTPLPHRFEHPGLHHPLMPRPLADGVVRFVGEPVVAVAAGTHALAQDAVDLVRVDYTPLPAAASVEAARAPGAPLVHDGAAGNLAGTYAIRLGDPDGAFRDTPVRLTFRLAISRGAAVPIEPRGCVASVDRATGALHMWASTQSPHHLKRTVEQMLGLPQARVRIMAPDVGGAFGVKGGAPAEYIVVACAALLTGRPVKWIESRREHFMACQHDRDQIHDVEIAGTTDGVLLVLRDRFLLDVGAYTLYGHLIGMHTVAHMVGPYRVAHMDVRLESTYTHRVPTGAYRGAGRPQGTFVIERAMDRLASALGLDPARVRERNLIPAGAMPWDTGLRLPDRPVWYDSGDYPRLLRVALERFDYPGWRSEQQRRRVAREGPYLGIGMACYVEETAAHGHETVALRMDEAGLVVITAGPPSQGQGHVPMLAQIVGRELALPPERLRVRTGDTGAVAESFGTHGSRVATLLGNAATLAARELAARLRTIAAEVAGCDPDAVLLRDGRTVLPGSAADGMGYGELVRRAMAGDGRDPASSEGLGVNAEFSPEGSAWSSGVHMVALEVDPDTGGVRITRYLVVHDSGKVLDEDAVLEQIVGGVVQGVGGALYERLVYDEAGQLLTATLLDYAVPRATQAPSVEIIRLESPSPLNPLGLKGAGQSGCMGVYAAVASALEDALAPLGLQVSALPATAAQVWEMLRDRVGRPQRW